MRRRTGYEGNEACHFFSTLTLTEIQCTSKCKNDQMGVKYKKNVKMLEVKKDSRVVNSVK